jgi:hypothetical protein
MAAEKNRYGESKSSFEKRAHEKGFWEKYVLQREAFKKVLVDRGEDPKAAAHTAWLEISAMFVLEPTAPPLPPIDKSLPNVPANPVPDSKAPFDLLDRSAFGEEFEAIAPRGVVEWVVNNVMIKEVTPRDAPTPWAWGMLLLARSSMDEFGKLRDTWNKLLPTKSQIEKGDAMEDDGRVLTILDRVIAAAERAKSDDESLTEASDQRSGP